MSLVDSAAKRAIVRGQGRYVADLSLPGTMHASFVRSDMAHASVTTLDTAEARTAPGVVAVFTGADLAGEVAPLRIEGPGHAAHDWMPLPTRTARFVGEALAVVVADDPYLAEDAAELVFADLDPLPAVVGVDASLAGDVLINPEAGTNVLFEARRTGGDPDAAFAEAHVVIERTFEYGRQTALPLETRGVLATVEESTGQLVIWTSTQIPHIVRTAVATALRRPERSVRVITPDVGGGFGLKASVFPEEIVVAWLATRLRRPVRWIEDRRENLMASAHAHDERLVCRVAVDAGGRLLALDVDVVADVGAYASYPFSASLEPLTTVGFVLAGYAVPNLRLRARGVATTKCPTGPYRGVGIPPAVFAGERLLDLLAAELGEDRVELRLQNLVPPERMPYTNPLGVVWDEGDYPAALREVVQRAGYQRYAGQREQRRDDGDEVVGIAAVFFNEHSGPGSLAYRGRGVATVPGFDAARVVVGPEGDTTVHVSSADAGQDHEGMFRTVVGRELCIAPTAITVLEGDTGTCPPGSGTFASRAGSAQISAVVNAARQVANRMREVAALRLQVPVEQVVTDDEGFTTRDCTQRLTFDDVARIAHLRVGDFIAPPGFSPGLEGNGVFDLPMPTYPYGAHFAAVALNRETFGVRLLRYVGVEDCGVVLNEESVHEQIVGAIAMGVGNALLEEHVYDDDGQLRTASLLDYAIPLVTDVTTFELHHLHTPTDRTPLGSRGVAEAGTIGAVGAIGVAVADAVQQLGAELNRLPATPRHVFDAVAKAQSSAAEAAP